VAGEDELLERDHAAVVADHHPAPSEAKLVAGNHDLAQTVRCSLTSPVMARSGPVRTARARRWSTRSPNPRRDPQG
jgi:hypothetical protein